ncbi:MAG: hypothetical protein J6U54_11775 [Clostridiales bacterium]|nr:hypothetical protein [Clostridiales bacterium]
MKTRKKQIMIFTVLLLVTIAFVCFTGCTKTTNEEESRMQITGRYVECENGDHMIVASIGEGTPTPILMTVASDSSLDIEWSDLHTGYEICVTCDNIAETWPAQTVIYSLEILSEGTEDDIPEDVFNQLFDSGWVEVSETTESYPYPVIDLIPDDYELRTEITDDYVAVFHGGSGEETYLTYIYKIDNGHDNYGFEYINVEQYGMTGKQTQKILSSGTVIWTEDVFPVAEENNAYDFVTVPNDNNPYTIDEFKDMFLMF